MIIRDVEPSDSRDWEVMRRDLWPRGADDHGAEIASFFSGTLPEPQAVLVAQDDRSLAGLAEFSVRLDIPGWEGKRVGYVEGLYVIPAWRGRGLARQLLTASKRWSRQNNCAMFARSDYYRQPFLNSRCDCVRS